MYTYNDFIDKSIEGIKKEVTDGMTKMIVYFQTTHGLSYEITQEKLENMDGTEKLLAYMNFRNKYPKVFE